MIAEWQNALKTDKKAKMPEKLGAAIFLIATNFANRPNFSGYSYKEDMIQDGVLNCIKYLGSNFDPTRSNANAFSYITQSLYFSFIATIKGEKKEMIKKCHLIRHAHAHGLYSSEDTAHHREGDPMQVWLDYMENAMPPESESKVKKVRVKPKGGLPC